MPRHKRCRSVAVSPVVTFFKPRGVPMVQLEQVVLELDEVEAMRLADFEGRYHEEAAKLMGVSRQTFGRIIEKARQKVADALLHGKAVAIRYSSTVVYRGMQEDINKREERRTMKIVVTAESEGLDARVDPRFGRCSVFVIVDPETMAHESIKNEATAINSGAGVSAAQTVVHLGASAVITGSCGPKGYMLLNQAGITVYTGATGTVRSAIEDFKAGKLASASGPNVPGHSGVRG